MKRIPEAVKHESEAHSSSHPNNGELFSDVSTINRDKDPISMMSPTPSMAIFAD
eukprot:CAMPEP_0170510120 /NCGR_PEP_ID=MMETSP0208-20121228/65594_1 /TAXON_ID=197538 /ORGANISM="Strombidium inclinatum, Strain S3" /LENGTH=53 /DNA_ID=CAMNT_0010793553 /DNA_START=634 /DNA_END=795 /DNA_ORIENTATION=-